MELEILSRETIKPSSPTPPHLYIHTLSLFDQLAPHIFIPLVFFFLRLKNDGSNTRHDVSESLRQSLSKTLSRYYPFAGRIKDNVSVECNDEGVTFLEGRVRNVRICEVLEGGGSGIVEELFVDGLQWKDSKLGALLGVQITYFECGGFAMGVILSHKLGDMATMVKFIKDWGLMNRDENLGQQIVDPIFDSADFFPHGDLPPMSGAVIEQGNFVCKRIVFEGSKIEALKNGISDKVENPTRVEVVTALIYKAIISASHSISNLKNNPHPTVMLQTLNLRTRVAPPLPETTVGSLVSFFPVAAAAEDKEVKIHQLVGTMRNELREFCNKYAKKYRKKECWGDAIKTRLQESRELLSKNQVVYRCSSGCKFGIYEVDFGWGTAAWVTMAAFKMKNTVMMLDAKNGGGIEALVSLEETEMDAFLHNEELLAFASFNPFSNNTK